MVPVHAQAVARTRHVNGLDLTISTETGDADLGISGVLPAVTYIIGNESQRGATVIAFVNPKDKRVVYIKETPRMAPDVGLFNMFIVNTGYRPDSVLPDEEQSAVLNIALDNATVKEMLSNRNYTNSYVHTVGTSNLKGGTNIRSEYPAASFMIINRSGTSYNIQAAVDIKNNKVIEVNAMGFPLPPEY